MKDLTSDNGRYYAVQQDDGNFVVYRKSDMAPLWDQWSHEFNNPPDIVSPIIEPILPDPPANPPQHDVDTTPVLIRRNVNPIGMSYWRNINQHRSQDTVDVVLADPDNFLVLLTLDKRSLQVINERRLGVYHTGEGIHFSAHNPHHLFVPYPENIDRVNTITQEHQPIWFADNGTYLWQCHFSYDEDVISASIQHNDWKIIKWGVRYHGETKYFEMRGEPDECQIDKSGEFLLIKEGNINRVITIRSGEEWVIENAQGALGHSDCGFGCALGENDMSNLGGALDMIDFQRRNSWNVYHTDVWNMGYFSYSNAKPGNPINQFGLLSSSDNRLIQVKLNGESRVVCDLLNQSQDYENRPKANLCPEGQFAVWTALVNGQRNAYMVKVPSI